ncbi:MAG TPA: NDP-sugar synthase [Acidimicrobiia bacterium]
MKAVVLVGGEGTRLRPLTYGVPKPLLPIANVPFLERQLTWLAAHGVDEVILSMGYLPDAFREHFPNDRFGDVRLRYAVEEKPLGTAGGIRFAADGIDERFVVCNSDVLTQLDLGAMLDFHGERGAEASIYLCQVDDPSAFGVVPTRTDGEVVGFIEKPTHGDAPTNWINAGIYIMEPAVLERIPTRVNVSIEREIFPRMVQTRGALYGYQYDGYWLDIGTPESYLRAHLDALGGKDGAIPAPGAQEIERGVWVQGDVAISTGATLHAPVLIGPEVQISSGATVGSSVIGAGAEISSGAHLVRSVLHRAATVATGAEVIDSVLGAAAHVGAGAGLADLTLVGAGASVGTGTRMSGGRVSA